MAKGDSNRARATRRTKRPPAGSASGQPDTPECLVGCSGWYYRHWKGAFYPPELASKQWFAHYQEHFPTVELNAPFYHWPKPETVKRWAREARSGFRYSVKVNRLITHQKRFQDTAGLVRDFYELLAPLGEALGCVLFQMPPSWRHEPARLEAMLSQLDPAFRNVIEFRHPSWWDETVYAAFRQAGAIFCSVSAPGLPDELVVTGPEVYLRMHGAARWYRHDYTEEELARWAARIRALSARRVWVYFNNDWQASAVRNAARLQELLSGKA
ncbi:MAG: DUF72 domain-containing protein [Verrucomicrobia bacterium]|nr:MAG: DUF72 domain-containing protein [Verrucomicrobiota bacterium]